MIRLSAPDWYQIKDYLLPGPVAMTSAEVEAFRLMTGHYDDDGTYVPLVPQFADLPLTIFGHLVYKVEAL